MQVHLATSVSAGTSLKLTEADHDGKIILPDSTMNPPDAFGAISGFTNILIILGILGAWSGFLILKFYNNGYRSAIEKAERVAEKRR